MRNIKNTVLLLTIIAIFLISAQIPADAGGDETLIMIASDLHYISGRLTDNGEYFMQLIESSDGKVANYIEEITDAFIAEVMKTAPNVLILSGDLSYNGALLSQIDLEEKLSAVKEAGIPVLVIPGNHDINYPYAASFSGDSYEKAQNTTAQEFRTIYENLGMKDAVSTDRYSGSYFYEINPDLWILMLDTNSIIENTIYIETLQWLENELEYARDNNIKVISVSHQNVLRHSQLFFYGYQIYQAEDLTALMRKSGVEINFSGHMHIQHISEDDGITEILTSSLAVYPHRYGIVKVTGQSMIYEAQILDVSGWAEENGYTDDELLNFSQYSRAFFINASKNGLDTELENMGVTDAEAEIMSAVFADTNVAYFSGVPAELEPMQEGISLWRKFPESFYTIYLNGVWDEISIGSDNLRLVIEN